MQKAIIQSLVGRSKRYGDFFFSRYEWQALNERLGLDLSENKLRKIIEQMRKEGIIRLVGVKKMIVDGQPRKINIYRASQELYDIFKTFVKTIEGMNAKIIEWCRSRNAIDTLLSFGFSVTSGGRIGRKNSDSKITVNRRTGSITEWKTGEKWNLFNYIRDHIDGMTTMNLFLLTVGKQ